MTSQRQPQLQFQQRKCRAGLGVAGREVKSDLSDLVQKEMEIHMWSGSSLRNRRSIRVHVMSVTHNEWTEKSGYQV